MILHLIADDRFADYAIKQFSRSETQSNFVLVKNSVEERVVNVKNTDNIQQFVADTDEFIEFIKKIKEDTSIVTHGLFYPWQEKVLAMVPSGCKIAWVCWGGEIYGRKELLYSFLKRKTKNIYFKKQIKRLINFKNLLGNEYFVPVSIYKRINYCLSDMQEEYQFVKKFTDSDMKFMWYNYYSVEETLGKLQHHKIAGNNILVGNSCTLENNHFDAFYSLSKFNITDRKIIVPLSYGSAWLRKSVINRGIKLFGSNLHPLTGLLELDDYNNLIASCSIVIMPHLRPQAQGNIITGLWLGAKVFLSERSMTYDYFKRIGAFVFSVEQDLQPTNKSALNILDSDKAQHNRKVLVQHYGRDNMMNHIRKIAEELNSKE